MFLRLLRDSRITHKAGEIINVVSPDEAYFLVSVGSAVAVGADDEPTVNPGETKRGKGRPRKTNGN